MTKGYLMKSCSISNNYVKRAMLGHYIVPIKNEQAKPTMTEKLHGKKPKNRYVQW